MFTFFILRREFPTMGLNNLRSSRSKLLLQSETSSKRKVGKGMPQPQDGFANVFVPKLVPKQKGELREIVIDGQNVAVEHAKGKYPIKDYW